MIAVQKVSSILACTMFMVGNYHCVWVPFDVQSTLHSHYLLEILLCVMKDHLFSAGTKLPKLPFTLNYGVICALNCIKPWMYFPVKIVWIIEGS